MKKFFSIVTLLLHIGFLTLFGQDLIITGVYDGPLTGGVPKGVELYVVNDIADLSLYGLGSANNGGGTDGEEFTLPAEAASAGDYIYVASEATEFENFFGFAPDYTSGAMGINGDDAVELFFNSSVSDVFGDINVDGNGEPWEYLDGWAYRINATGPDGSTFTLSSWTFSGPNALDGETSNATAATPVPVGTYSNAAPAAEQTSSSAGNGLQTVFFGNGTGVTNINIIDVTTSGDLTVQRWADDPADAASIAGTVSTYRWIITAGTIAINNGDGYTIQFNLSDLPGFGGVSEGDATIHLWKRSTPGSGAFSDVGSMTYNDPGTPGDQSDDFLTSPLITDGFSEFAFGSEGTDSSLPVELQSFTLIAGDRQVLIKWKTASESENVGFIIFRADAENAVFFEISSYRFNEDLEGLGTSNSGKTYSYLDADLTLKNGQTYYYKLADVDFSGTVTLHGPISATPTVEGEIPGEVHTFELAQNYPNPFNPETVIRVSLDNPVDNAEIAVFDVSGRLIKTLYSGPISGYTKSVKWDGRDFSGANVSSGLYFYRYKSEKRMVMKKMLLIK